MNHNPASRVASPTPPTERLRRAADESAALRREIRTHGEALDALLREGIAQAVAACDHTPAPRMMFSDLQRGRPASLVTIGAALVVLSRQPAALPELEALAARCAAWIRSLAPQPDSGLQTAFAHEARRQAVADVVVTEALVSPCPTALERAEHATSEHIAASRELLRQLVARRRRLAHERERARLNGFALQHGAVGLSRAAS